MLDVFKEIVKGVKQCRQLVLPFFFNRGGGFVVIVDLYGVWIQAMKPSILGEFVYNARCGVVGKFCER